MTSQTDSLGHAATFHFDALNRLDWTLDRDGRLRAFTYDFAGRKTGELWYSDDGETLYDTLAYTYDLAGNQLTAANAAGTHTLEYDELNRAIHSTQPSGVEMDFTYDELNRAIHSTQPSGVEMDFTYDEVGNRVRVQDSQGGDELSIYDAAHQLVRRAQTVVTGAETTAISWVDFFYDADGRQIASLRHQADVLGDDPSESPAPAVVGVVVNGGPGVARDRYANAPYLPGQNSVVVQLLVTFNRGVLIDDEFGGLERRGGGPVQWGGVWNFISAIR